MDLATGDCRLVLTNRDRLRFPEAVSTDGKVVAVSDKDDRVVVVDFQDNQARVWNGRCHIASSLLTT